MTLGVQIALIFYSAALIGAAVMYGISRKIGGESHRFELMTVAVSWLVPLLSILITLFGIWVGRSGGPFPEVILLFPLMLIAAVASTAVALFANLALLVRTSRESKKG